MRGIRWSIAWATIGSAALAGSQWAILVWLIQQGTVELVGAYTLALAITAPVFLLLSLNLRVAQATDARREYRFAAYMTLRLSAAAIGIALVGIIGIVWDGIQQIQTTLLIVATVKALEGVSDVYVGRLQQLERVDLVGRQQLIKAGVTLCAFLLGWTFGRTLHSALTALAIGWVFLVAADHVVCARTAVQSSRLHEPASRRNWLSIRGLRRLLAATLPLGVVALIDSLLVNVPKYFLQSEAGLSEVGFFSSLAYLMAIGGTAVGAIGYAVTPRLSVLWRDSSVEFSRLLMKSCAAAAAIGLALLSAAAIAGEDLLALIYSDEYRSYRDELIVILVAGLCWYMAGILGCGVNATRRFDFQLGLYVVALGVLISVSYLLIPKFGVAGAAYALLATMGTRFVLGAAAVVWLMGRRV